MSSVLVSKDIVTLRQYSYFYYSFTGVSVLTILMLLVFIAKTDGERGFKSVFSPFNVALLLCGASILGLLISQGKRFEIDIDCFKDGIDPRIDRRAIGCNLFLFTSTAAMETSYIYYSWKRAGGIIDRVFPRNGKFVHHVVRASPYIFFVQIVPFIVRLFIPTQYVRLLAISLPLAISILSGLCAVIIDAILMTAFIIFVRRTKCGDVQDADFKFLLISKFGIAAILLAIFALISFATFGTTGWLLFQTMTHVLFFLTYCILCAMKWALWRNDVQEKSTAVGRVSGRSRSKAVSETKSAPKSTTLEPPQSQNEA